MSITEGNTNIRGKTARGFFAIWPDDTAQKQLALLAERLQAEPLCSGQKTKTENIHLTLVFVGEVDVDKLKTLCVVANGIKGPGVRAFDFVIKEICYWKHNQVAYAAAGETPQELMYLVSALQDALFAAGFPMERRAYKPHITLMRKASCHSLPKLAKPIVWQVREWMLVKSEQTSDGPVYIPIGHWPLGNL